jgi:hypothetical protein
VSCNPYNFCLFRGEGGVCILLSVFTLDFTSFLNYFLYNFPYVYACLFLRLVLIHLKKETVSEVLYGVV